MVVLSLTPGVPVGCHNPMMYHFLGLEATGGRRAVNTGPKCGILDPETGEICQEYLHGLWPFCFQHGQEYKDYLNQCAKGYLVPLETAVWRNWRRKR